MLFSEKVVANETKEIVQKEEQQATKKAEETQAIADDAQRDLSEALPALVSASNHSYNIRLRGWCNSWT